MTAPILLFGGSGQVGREIQDLITSQSISLIAPASSSVDIAELESVRQVAKEAQPCCVINTAAYTAVDKAESETQQAFAINRDGAENIARVCNELQIPLLHVSTDYVFDGEKSGAYSEDDEVSPLNVYGESKWQGEQVVQESLAQHVILRTSWVFGQYGNNFVKTMLRLGRERDELSIVDDQRGCPTPAVSIARALLSISQQVMASNNDCWGIYHYCGKPDTSWYGFAHQIFEELSKAGQKDIPELKPISTAEFPTPATRPRQTIMSCDKIQQQFGIESADWQSELREVIATLNAS